MRQPPAAPPAAPIAARLGRRRLLGLMGALALAQGPFPAAAQARRPFSARVIQSGHSLTDPIVPMLDAMVAAVGRAEARGRVIDRSTIPGSPMDWRWNNRPAHGPDARHDIARYEVLVLTERVPLSNTLPWHQSDAMALRWANHAWTQGNGGRGAEVILYASWVALDSGPGYANPHGDPEGHLPFRVRLPLEMARWQSIADHVNANRPAAAPPMRLIPGPLIMAAAHDAIAAGTAPGLRSMADLFTDAIHLNAAGSYLIALAHLAVIYGQDPREVPDRLGRTEVPPPPTAAWMRALVQGVLGTLPAPG